MFNPEYFLNIMNGLNSYKFIFATSCTELASICFYFNAQKSGLDVGLKSSLDSVKIFEHNSSNFETSAGDNPQFIGTDSRNIMAAKTANINYSFRFTWTEVPNIH